MAKLTNWLIGCGIGCGVLVLIVVALIAGGVFWVRETFKEFGEAEASHGLLVKTHGQPADFRPWPEGQVPAERIEAFLAVREASDAKRRRVAELFEALLGARDEARTIESKGKMEQLRFALGMGQSAFGMAGELGGFLQARNQAMLEREMGLGEYAYLYCLAYQGYLRRSPHDGPMSAWVRIDLEGDGRAKRESGGHDGLPRHVREDLLAVLRAARDAMPEEPATDAARQWRQTLVAEIEAMEQERGRYAWEDGAPPSVTSAFEPYRERLETTYNKVTNPFELAHGKESNNFDFDVEVESEEAEKSP